MEESAWRLEMKRNRKEKAQLIGRERRPSRAMKMQGERGRKTEVRDTNFD